MADLKITTQVGKVAEYEGIKTLLIILDENDLPNEPFYLTYKPTIWQRIKKIWRRKYD